VTSLLAAAIAFCFLGFLAVQLEESDVRAMCRGQVAPHLLWDQILRALGHLAPSEAALFSFLYQLMLVICAFSILFHRSSFFSSGAIDCTFTWCETLTSSLQNKIPLLKDRPRILTAIVCVVFFLLSLPCCFQVRYRYNSNANIALSGWCSHIQPFRYVFDEMECNDRRHSSVHRRILRIW
jgi:hypothetical protein